MGCFMIAEIYNSGGFNNIVIRVRALVEQGPRKAPPPGGGLPRWCREPPDSHDKLQNDNFSVTDSRKCILSQNYLF